MSAAPRASAPSPSEHNRSSSEGSSGTDTSEDSPGPAAAQSDRYFETYGGRRIPKRPCVYALPVDEQEDTRLNIGHEMICMAQPGLFLGPAHDVLDPLTSTEPKQILDIGTGNGAWAMEVAQQYEGAKVLGLDIVPIQSKLRRVVPPNCTFQLQDANNGLPAKVASVDLIHARNVQLGITDYPRLISECARVLKPGGLLNLIEGDWDVYDEDGDPCTPTTNPGWYNWITAWRAASSHRNVDVSAPMRTEQWLRDCPYLESVTAAARWMPVGAWTPDEGQNRLGSVVWDNLRYLIPSIRPMLVEFLGTEQWADWIIANAWAELASPQSKVFMRWRFFHARRNTQPYVNRTRADPALTRRGRGPAVGRGVVPPGPPMMMAPAGLLMTQGMVLPHGLVMPPGMMVPMMMPMPVMRVPPPAAAGTGRGGPANRGTPPTWGGTAGSSSGGAPLTWGVTRRGPRRASGAAAAAGEEEQGRDESE